MQIFENSSCFNHQKRFSKNKKFNFSIKVYKMQKKCWRQNCWFQDDIQIHFEPFFDLTRSFHFNRKKRYQKWKIPFCTKSMWDTKKMIGNKIIRFRKIYKFSIDYFYIGVVYFLIFNKNFFIKIKNSIFPPKYTRYGKTVRKEICLFQKDIQLWYWPFFYRNYIF